MQGSPRQRSSSSALALEVHPQGVQKYREIVKQEQMATYLRQNANAVWRDFTRMYGYEHRLIDNALTAMQKLVKTQPAFQRRMQHDCKRLEDIFRIQMCVFNSIRLAQTLLAEIDAEDPPEQQEAQQEAQQEMHELLCTVLTTTLYYNNTSNPTKAASLQAQFQTAATVRSAKDASIQALETLKAELLKNQGAFVTLFSPEQVLKDILEKHEQNLTQPATLESLESMQAEIPNETDLPAKLNETCSSLFTTYTASLNALNEALNEALAQTTAAMPGAPAAPDEADAAAPMAAQFDALCTMLTQDDLSQINYAQCLQQLELYVDTVVQDKACQKDSMYLKMLTMSLLAHECCVGESMASKYLHFDKEGHRVSLSPQNATGESQKIFVDEDYTRPLQEYQVSLSQLMTHRAETEAPGAAATSIQSQDQVAAEAPDQKFNQDKEQSIQQLNTLTECLTQIKDAQKCLQTTLTQECASGAAEPEPAPEAADTAGSDSIINQALVDVIEGLESILSDLGTQRENLTKLTLNDSTEAIKNQYDAIDAIKQQLRTLQISYDLGLDDFQQRLATQMFTELASLHVHSSAEHEIQSTVLGGLRLDSMHAGKCFLQSLKIFERDLAEPVDSFSELRPIHTLPYQIGGQDGVLTYHTDFAPTENIEALTILLERILQTTEVSKKIQLALIHSLINGEALTLQNITQNTEAWQSFCKTNSIKPPQSQAIITAFSTTSVELLNQFKNKLTPLMSSLMKATEMRVDGAIEGSYGGGVKLLRPEQIYACSRSPLDSRECALFSPTEESLAQSLTETLDRMKTFVTRHPNLLIPMDYGVEKFSEQLKPYHKHCMQVHREGRERPHASLAVLLDECDECDAADSLDVPLKRFSEQILYLDCMIALKQSDLARFELIECALTYMSWPEQDPEKWRYFQAIAHGQSQDSTLLKQSGADEQNVQMLLQSFRDIFTNTEGLQDTDPDIQHALILELLFSTDDTDAATDASNEQLAWRSTIEVLSQTLLVREEFDSTPNPAAGGADTDVVAASELEAVEQPAASPASQAAQQAFINAFNPDEESEQLSRFKQELYVLKKTIAASGFESSGTIGPLIASGKIRSIPSETLTYTPSSVEISHLLTPGSPECSLFTQELKTKTLERSNVHTMLQGESPLLGPEIPDLFKLPTTASRSMDAKLLDSFKLMKSYLTHFLMEHSEFLQVVNCASIDEFPAVFHQYEMLWMAHNQKGAPVVEGTRLKHSAQAQFDVPMPETLKAVQDDTATAIYFLYQSAQRAPDQAPDQVPDNDRFAAVSSTCSCPEN